VEFETLIDGVKSQMAWMMIEWQATKVRIFDFKVMVGP